MNPEASENKTAVAHAGEPAAGIAANGVQENEHFYRHVIDSTVDGFSQVDTRYSFVQVNDRFCELFGYPREELLGRSPFEFITEASRATLADQVKRIPMSAIACCARQTP